MQKITFEDVVEFVALNSDETEWMDKLNKLTFPFTSKYKYQSGFQVWDKKETKKLTTEDLEEIVKKPFNI